MAEMQLIPARHGVATFVPAGQTIKIINTSGGQVIDTWAFALPEPEAKKGVAKEDVEEKEDPKEEEKPKQEEKAAPKPAPKKNKKDMALPSQEDAEKATQEVLNVGDQKGKDAQNKATPQKNTWSSYVPTLRRSQKPAEAPKNDETQVQKNSRTWASYFPSGKGFSSYIPKTASDTVAAFAKDHERDTTKSYLEQLQDFSKTPVGAAGLAAVTGSGYGGSLYAGYNAWNAAHAASAPAMEYMSMPHTRAATLHMRPKVNDTLVSNLREPMITMVEDTSPGIHDTLIAACDPERYHGLGVDNWEQHGSCAENLVLALKELNDRAGLKGAKGVGADVTINSVPAPLNLFMNIPWTDEGELDFKAPKGKDGDYVRFKAERDIVVVMSACPQDVLDINNKKPTDAHFIVEEDEEPAEAEKVEQPKKRGTPRKISRAPSVATTDATANDTKAGAAPAKRPVPARRSVPQNKAVGAATGDAAKPAQKKPVPRPVQAQKTAEATPKAQEANGDANGTAPAPVERKKPRKLATKPKAEAPTDS